LKFLKRGASFLILATLGAIGLSSCQENTGSVTAILDAPIGATIREEQINEEREKGINNLVVNLDGGKVNRVTARRDANKIKEYPGNFGSGREFKPLLETIVTGPGNLHIEGEVCVPHIIIPIKEGTWRMEVYPQFNQEFLKSGDGGEKEKLQFSFEDNKGNKMPADNYEVTWAGPREIFLSEAGIESSASLVFEGTHQNKEKPLAIRGSAKEWLEDTARRIRTMRIHYATGNPSKDWQHVKTEEEIFNTKEANCLDMAVYICSLAQTAGLDGYIVTTDGHAFVGVGSHQAGEEDVTYLETTMLLIQPNSVMPSIREAEQQANREILEASNAQPSQAVSLKAEDWKPIYGEK
jgi:hypothetical protein